MSPRAASRLEGLGFSKVYDYPPGKAGWSASGFPTEGTQANAATIGGAAGRSTCALAEKVGTARERVREAGWDR